ncbi:hypothetical protein U1Q18_015404, partial [Sarracenia purpurea var. burkii]
ARGVRPVAASSHLEANRPPSEGGEWVFPRASYPPHGVCMLFAHNLVARCKTFYRPCL